MPSSGVTKHPPANPTVPRPSGSYLCRVSWSVNLSLNALHARYSFYNISLSRPVRHNSAGRLPPVNDVKGEIRMELAIHHRLPHVDQEHLNLQRRPLQACAERPSAQTAQPVHDGGAHEQATQPQALVARPDADGALVGDDLDGLEPRGLHLVGEANDGVQLAAEGAEARFEEVGEVTEGVGDLGGEAAVVALRREV